MARDEKKGEKLHEQLTNTIDNASLNRFETEHKDALYKFEGDMKTFKVETYMADRITQCL